MIIRNRDTVNILRIQLKRIISILRLQISQRILETLIYRKRTINPVGELNPYLTAGTVLSGKCEIKLLHVLHISLLKLSSVLHRQHHLRCPIAVCQLLCLAKRVLIPHDLVGSFLILFRSYDLIKQFLIDRIAVIHIESSAYFPAGFQPVQYIHGPGILHVFHVFLLRLSCQCQHGFHIHQMHIFPGAFRTADIIKFLIPGFRIVIKYQRNTLHFIFQWYILIISK